MKKINYLSFFCHCEGNIGKTPQLNVIASVSEAIHKKYHKWIAALPLVARNDAHGKVFKSKVAFTLAEVLITLTIIGVIAALTIPNLMQKYHEQEMITRLKKVHTVLSNAYSQAIRENGSPDDWDINPAESSDGAVKVYKYIAPYLKIQKYCGIEAGCFASHYKALFNDSFWWDIDTNTSGVKVILEDGSSLRISSSGSGCNGNVSKTNSKPLNRICFAIHADLNGKKRPNIVGVDYFTFLLSINDEVVPIGTKDYSNYYICEYKNNSNKNGAACTAWALYKGNMDYLRKNISW